MIELALGTAQFGMKYGIAGRGEPVPEKEVRRILARAWELGIRVIDTATGYGYIEEALCRLMGDHAFKMVSKIPAKPLQSSDSEIEDHVYHSIERIRLRLGERLHAILFHRSDDLLDEGGELIWDSAFEKLMGTNILLGVSCYADSELQRLTNRYPITIAQLPGNAFDQQALGSVGCPDMELHLRSIFLQGILLLDPYEVEKRLPQAKTVVWAWRSWCLSHGLSQLQAALSIVKASTNGRYCVVGVDRLSQLEEIVEAWELAHPISAPELAIVDKNIIHPGYWHKVSYISA